MNAPTSVLSPHEHRDIPFIRTLNVDTTNRPGTYRNISDALDAVEDSIRTLIIVAAGTYDMGSSTLVIGGGALCHKQQRTIDVEIRGASDAVPVLTSKQTTIHVSLPACGDSATSACRSYFTLTGIRVESSNPLYPAVLVTGGAPLFYKASLQSMHLDNEGTLAYVDSCKVTDAPSTGILVTGGASCDIRKTEFRRALLYHIMFDCLSSPHVTGCSFFDSGRGAIVINGTARCSPHVTKCVIQDQQLGQSANAMVDLETGAITMKCAAAAAASEGASTAAHQLDPLMSSSASIAEGSSVPRAAIVIAGAARPVIDDNTIFDGVGSGLAVYGPSFIPHRVVSLDAAMGSVHAMMAAKRAFGRKKKTVAPNNKNFLPAPAPSSVASSSLTPLPSEAPSDLIVSEEQTAPSSSTTQAAPDAAASEWKLGEHNTLPGGDPQTKIRKNVFRDNAQHGVLVRGELASLSIAHCEFARNRRGGCVAEDNGRLFVFSCSLQQHSAGLDGEARPPASSSADQLGDEDFVPACWAKEGRNSLVRLHGCKLSQNQVGCLAEHGGRIVLQSSCVIEDCQRGVYCRHSGLIDAVDTTLSRCSMATCAASCGGGIVRQCVIESNGVGYGSTSGGCLSFLHTPFRRNGTAVDVGHKGAGDVSSCVISDSTGTAGQVILGDRASPTIRNCDLKSATCAALVCRPQCRGIISECTFTGHKGLEIVRLERACDVIIDRCRFIGAERNVLVFHEGAGGTVLHSEVSSACRAGVVVKALAEPTLRGNKIHFNSIGVELLPASVGMLEKNIIAENREANVQTSGVPPAASNNNNNNAGGGLSNLPFRSDWQPYISTVSKNSISGGEFGVKVLAGARTQISRNVVVGCTYGVYCGGSKQSESSNIACMGNEFRKNVCAIALLGGETTGGVFIGNVIRDSGACGMWVAAGSEPTVLDNIFMGHFCTLPAAEDGGGGGGTAVAANERCTSVPLRLDSGSRGSFGRNRFMFNSVGVVAHPSTLAVFAQNYYAHNEFGFVYTNNTNSKRRCGRSDAVPRVGGGEAQHTPHGYAPAKQKKNSDSSAAADTTARNHTPPELPSPATEATPLPLLSSFCDASVFDADATLCGLLLPHHPADGTTFSGTALNAPPEHFAWAIPLDDEAAGEGGGSSAAAPDHGGALLLGETFLENVSAVVVDATTGGGLLAPLRLDACVFLNSKQTSIFVAHQAATVRVTNSLFHHHHHVETILPTLGTESGASGAGEHHPRGGHHRHILFQGGPPRQTDGAASSLSSTSKRQPGEGDGSSQSAVIGPSTSTSSIYASPSIAAKPTTAASPDEDFEQCAPSRCVVQSCVLYGVDAQVEFTQKHRSASVFACSFISSGVLSRHESLPLIVGCSFVGYPMYVNKLLDAHFCKARVDFVTEPSSMEWCLQHGAFQRTSRIPLTRDSFAGKRAITFQQRGAGVVYQCTIGLYQEGIVFDGAAVVAAVGRMATRGPATSTGSLDSIVPPSACASMVSRSIITRCRDAGVVIGNSGVDDREATSAVSVLEQCVIAHNFGVGLLIRGRCGSAPRCSIPLHASDATAAASSPTAARAAQQHFAPIASSADAAAVLSPRRGGASAEPAAPPQHPLIHHVLVYGHIAVPLLPRMLQSLSSSKKGNNNGTPMITHSSPGRAYGEELQQHRQQQQQDGKSRDELNAAAVEVYLAESAMLRLCDISRDRPFGGNDKNPHLTMPPSWRYPVRYGTPDHLAGSGIGVWVDVSGSVSLSHCAFVKATIANVVFSGRLPAALTNVFISQAEGFGAVVQYGAAPILHRVLVAHNGYAGVLLDTNSAALVDQCSIVGNRVGVYASAVKESTRIQSCTLLQQEICAIRSVDGAHLVVDHCTVEGNRGGIEIASSPVLVRACNVVNNTYCGIVVSGCFSDVQQSSGSPVPTAKDNPLSPSSGGSSRPTNSCFEATVVSCVVRANHISGIVLRNGAIASVQRCLVDSNALTGLLARTSSILRCVECTFSRNGTGMTAEWKSRGVVTQCLFSKNVERSFHSKSEADVRVARNLFLEDAPVAVSLEGKGTFTHNTFRKPRSNCFLVSQGGAPRILHTRFVLLHSSTTDVLHAKLLEERNLETLMDPLPSAGGGGGEDERDSSDDAVRRRKRSLLDCQKLASQRHYIDSTEQFKAFSMPVDHQQDVQKMQQSSLLVQSGGPPPPLPHENVGSPMPPVPAQHTPHPPSRTPPSRAATGGGFSRPSSSIAFDERVGTTPVPPVDISDRSDDHVDLEMVHDKEENEYGSTGRAEKVTRTSVTALRRRSSVAIHRTEVEASRRKSYVLHPDVSTQLAQSDDQPTTAAVPQPHPRRAAARRTSFFVSADDDPNASIVTEETVDIASPTTSPPPSSHLPRALSVASLKRNRRISSHRLDVDYGGGAARADQARSNRAPSLQTQLQKDLISDQRDDFLAASTTSSHSLPSPLSSSRGGGGAAGRDRDSSTGAALDGEGPPTAMDHVRVPIVFEAGGGGIISNCVFAHNLPCSILCDGPGAMPSIESNLFYDHRLCALVVTGDAGATVARNFFTRNANAIQAFYANGAKLLLDHNQFRLNLSAFEAIEGDCGTVQGCTHLQDEMSILCGSGGLVKIIDGVFVGCESAVVAEPNSILLVDNIKIVGCSEAVTLQSDEPTSVNPVGHADGTTEVLRNVFVQCCVNGIRIGNRRDAQLQHCVVNTCALVGLELTAPPAQSVLSNVPSSVMVVNMTVQGCRTGIHLDGEACVPTFACSSSTSSFYAAVSSSSCSSGPGSPKNIGTSGTSCAVSFCGTGVLVSNGSVPRMEHMAIRQCLKGLVVEKHAAGTFRHVEVCGCEAGILLSSGDEDFPLFQHCLVYDCATVGLYFDRGAAGQFIDGVVFECGVGAMFTEGSYTYLAHTKISHPSNNIVTRKNDAMRVARFAAPRVGPNIDLQYQGSPAHNSRTARMRRIDQEKQREAYHEEELPRIMAEWDTLRSSAVQCAERFLVSFGMCGSCMVTLPTSVVAASSGVGGDGETPSLRAAASIATVGSMRRLPSSSNSVDERIGAAAAAAAKFQYAVEIYPSPQTNSSADDGLIPQPFLTTAPAGNSHDVLLGSRWTVRSSRDELLELCREFDEAQVSVVPPPHLGDAAATSQQLNTSSITVPQIPPAADQASASPPSLLLFAGEDDASSDYVPLSWWAAAKAPPLPQSVGPAFAAAARSGTGAHELSPANAVTALKMHRSNVALGSLIGAVSSNDNEGDDDAEDGVNVSHQRNSKNSTRSLLAAHLRRRGSHEASVYTLGELRSMEDEPESPESADCPPPLLPPLKIAVVPVRPYPTMAAMKHRQEKQQQQQDETGKAASERGAGNISGAGVLRLLPPVPTQWSLRLLQRPQTDSMAPATADALASIAKDHNTIYAQQLLTIFTLQLDPRQCGGVTATDCAAYLRSVIALFEGDGQRGSDADDHNSDIEKDLPTVQQQHVADPPTDGAAKKSKKRKTIRRKRGVSVAASASTWSPLVDGLAVPEAMLREEVARHPQRGSNDGHDENDESPSSDPPLDDPSALLTAAQLDRVHIRFVVYSHFSALRKTPETDLLNLQEFEQLLSKHQKKSGRLPNYLRKHFPWMGMPQPLVDGDDSGMMTTKQPPHSAAARGRAGEMDENSTVVRVGRLQRGAGV